MSENVPVLHKLCPGLNPKYGVNYMKLIKRHERSYLYYIVKICNHDTEPNVSNYTNFIAKRFICSYWWSAKANRNHQCEDLNLKL